MKMRITELVSLLTLLLLMPLSAVAVQDCPRVIPQNMTTRSIDHVRVELPATAYVKKSPSIDSFAKKMITAFGVIEIDYGLKFSVERNIRKTDESCSVRINGNVLTLSVQKRKDGQVYAEGMVVDSSNEDFASYIVLRAPSRELMESLVGIATTLQFKEIEKIRYPKDDDSGCSETQVRAPSAPRLENLVACGQSALK